MRIRLSARGEPLVLTTKARSMIFCNRAHGKRDAAMILPADFRVKKIRDQRHFLKSGLNLLRLRLPISPLALFVFARIQSTASLTFQRSDVRLKTNLSELLINGERSQASVESWDGSQSQR